MEIYYQRKKQLKDQCYQTNDYIAQLDQSEIPPPLYYENIFSLRDKEKIFKDVYSSIEMFNKLAYDATKQFNRNKNDPGT